MKSANNIMSIDIGVKRIGLAIYQAAIILPIEPIIRKNRIQASKELRDIIEKRNISKIVIGLPVHSAFKEESAARAKHFISLLKFNGQIEYIDEDLSSKEAQQRLKGQNISKKSGILDSVSAQIILERYIKNAP